MFAPRLTVYSENDAPHILRIYKPVTDPQSDQVLEMTIAIT